MNVSTESWLTDQTTCWSKPADQLRSDGFDDLLIVDDGGVANSPRSLKPSKKKPQSGFTPKTGQKAPPKTGLAFLAQARPQEEAPSPWERDGQHCLPRTSAAWPKNSSATPRRCRRSA